MSRVYSVALASLPTSRSSYVLLQLQLLYFKDSVPSTAASAAVLLGTAQLDRKIPLVAAMADARNDNAVTELEGDGEARLTLGMLYASRSHGHDFLLAATPSCAVSQCITKTLLERGDRAGQLGVHHGRGNAALAFDRFSCIRVRCAVASNSRGCLQNS